MSTRFERLSAPAHGDAAAQPREIADRALRFATAAWFAVTVLGQLAFLWYVAGFYGRAIVLGNIEDWNRNKSIFQGYVPGDPAWNGYFGAHVVMAAAVTFGGTLQLIPQLRARAAWFHRWNGRVFMVAALGGALTGLWMTLVRRIGISGDSSLGVIAISLNAVLIIAFAAIGWRAIRGGNATVHRRWAMRLFMVTNGVWFLRLAMYGWYWLTGGIGLTSDLDGPLNFVFSFASYLVPLAVLELYLRTGPGSSTGRKLVTASALAIVTAYMILGSFILTAARLPLLLE